MKYLFLSFLILSGCASFYEVDEFAEFERLENTEAKYSPSEIVAVEPEIFSDFQEEFNRNLEYESSIQPTNHSRSFYTLQVGAYPTKKMAKLSVSKLNLKNYPVIFEKALVNGKTWQRVCVGKFRDKKSAVFLQKQISGESFVRVIDTEN
jgi:cell division protein FtsN